MTNPNQVTIITHEQLVRKNHPYRKILAIINFRNRNLEEDNHTHWPLL